MTRPIPTPPSRLQFAASSCRAPPDSRVRVDRRAGDVHRRARSRHSGSEWPSIGCSNHRPPFAASALVAIGRHRALSSSTATSSAACSCRSPTRPPPFSSNAVSPSCRTTSSPPSTSSTSPAAPPTTIPNSFRKPAKRPTKRSPASKSLKLFNRGPLAALCPRRRHSHRFDRRLCNLFANDVSASGSSESRSANSRGRAASTWKSSASRPMPAGQRIHKLAQDDDSNSSSTPVPMATRSRTKSKSATASPMAAAAAIRSIRVGEAPRAAGRFQLFRYEFKHVTGNMDFDIVGGDDRVRDLHLQVVDRPELSAHRARVRLPRVPRPRAAPSAGHRRHANSRGHAARPPRQLDQTAHRRRQSMRTKDKNETSLDVPRHRPSKSSQWDYGTLTADDVLIVNVTDTDGVASREPYRVSLSAVKDEVPQVAVRLSGISTAITPDAVLAVRRQNHRRLWPRSRLVRVPGRWRQRRPHAASRATTARPARARQNRFVRYARHSIPKRASECSRSSRSNGSHSRSKRPTATT